ncbi:hypothetical protein MTP10_30340 [Nonomuraea sp. 3-1Str]|uniref:hypothetical protein n=1 Tax=Nonomuraea sp. 3-1Str TaxID=2929801 RepID=UPI00285DAD11|nr:hypothetical protein [Nonomuraea sp. 3-1Str]MDR8413019.1 hypothetical protein [Nonomuraea sp. 3-1Str]
MNHPALSQSEAVARVEQLVRDTAGAVSPPPRLELIESSVPPHTCLSGDQPQGKVVVGRAYWLRDVPKGEQIALSQQISAHWQAQGHRITASGKPGAIGVNAMSPSDGFILALTLTKEGELYLAASSPCVWPDGTPSP